jgi:cysteinyl-tRNA synthetase
MPRQPGDGRIDEMSSINEKKPLLLYNTLTRRKSELRPRDEGKVGMYVCGPTVYDYSHIGHARAYVFFDVLFRFLKFLGYEVTYVRNVTDLDDKLIRKANDEGLEVREVAERYTAAFHEDMERLGNLPPTVEPRATDHIEDMHGLIAALLERGIAYRVDGDVYYSVDAFRDYGKLSRRDLQKHVAGARVDVDERLKSPADFALWKSAKPGEPSWPSPWGPGRPGWHIECSAMSRKYLGADFDIHGGGMDLIFPHHENEIAQSEGAWEKPFCRVFLHNGFVNVNKEKMSKSLGNFFLIRQVLEHVDSEALRFFLMGTHYRGPIDLMVDLDGNGRVRAFPQVLDAQKRIVYFYETRRRVEELLPGSGGAPASAPPKEIAKKLDGYESSILDALCDDVNTAAAVGHMSDAFRFINVTLDGMKKGGDARRAAAQAMAALVKRTSSLMGILEKDTDAFLDAYTDRRLAAMGLGRQDIAARIEERTRARASKDYGRADEIRDELLASGIELMDGKGGTRFRVKD